MSEVRYKVNPEHNWMGSTLSLSVDEIVRRNIELGIDFYASRGIERETQKIDGIINVVNAIIGVLSQEQRDALAQQFGYVREDA